MPLTLRTDNASVGNIYAHLFENARNGLSRNLYWSLTVPCLPIRWEEDDHECSITCEWLVWPVRDWRQLDGMSLSATMNPELRESSLYLSDHHPVSIDHLQLTFSGTGARFKVSLAGTVSLEGFDELDGTNMKFSLESEVNFEGLIVVPGNLIPKPQNESDVLDALAPYAELGAFAPPVLERFRYVLAPVAGDA